MKPFSSITFLLLLFASCSQESVLDNGGAVEIRLNGEIGNVGGSVTTRQVVDDSYFTTNDLSVSFLRLDQKVAGTWQTYAEVTAPLPATRTKGTGNQTITFNTTQYYLTRESNNSTKLIGWYPNTGTYSSSAGTVTFSSLNGYTDVMLTNEVTANKKESEQFGKSGKTFTFKHLLTQVVVKAYGDATAGTNWGAITSIKVKDCKSQCKVTLPGQTPTFEGSVADLVIKKTGTDTDMSSITIPDGSANAVTCGYLLLPPVTTNTLTLLVSTDKGGPDRPVTVTLPAGSTFAAGTSYTVILEFKSTAIAPTATVTAWTSATNNPSADL